MIFQAAPPFVGQELRRYGTIRDLVVAADCRGMGVGRALVDHSAQFTHAAGLAHLRVGVVAGNDRALLYCER